ncbi:MAG: 6-carboxytetrahydropterin synthase QueD [Mesorhizobium sp.]|uniref:6-carboxytetrahydropterin synthase QueD n=1 Tax=Mesorhizobium TaxID=68287 RepID=UPI00049440F7|nr:MULTISPECIES: 6-carboxytetrahydropterin synthase QueD [Mesorhizobium]RUU47927.1 6-carboxytetrahydropterin synthase QueD [Mesorhizobium sp. M6A.T.Ca.TU.002.02.2.1]RVD73202.1 6-carboxytetrahydropterin synthase QueD [Mesorhizobium sp. M4A.F.Ca.ET.029.04.2.1]AZN97966.1 6-carboxytetrahydropterin synthase QueD [Mesorhizobium sp. M9A.F.Ca.ET.002.03.1.2]AZO19618.1 6-carboxytetrahydropterin synthase QueD [Mesorhizobium sp. M1E.F.Ca.ET.045.02.1.1]MCF6114654.1 6-carboxytetrahydropterin synthase QueD [
MFHISKEFHFSASHQLTSLPPNHQCARLHGHNYIVVVELSAKELDARGFVRDYHDLAPLKRYIDESFDHRHLNDVLGHEKVTAECLARHFYEWCKARLPQTTAVRVSETPKTWAEYRP